PKRFASARCVSHASPLPPTEPASRRKFADDPRDRVVRHVLTSGLTGPLRNGDGATGAAAGGPGAYTRRRHHGRMASVIIRPGAIGLLILDGQTGHRHVGREGAIDDLAARNLDAISDAGLAEFGQLLVAEQIGEPLPISRQL